MQGMQPGGLQAWMGCQVAEVKGHRGARLRACRFVGSLVYAFYYPPCAYRVGLTHWGAERGCRSCYAMGLAQAAFLQRSPLGCTSSRGVFRPRGGVPDSWVLRVRLGRDGWLVGWF
jgi:hypothetical protein